MAAVIDISGLRKEYGHGRRRVVALDGLDLSVPAGGVFGFLGPNGSGKTTTIRCLLGLARPNGGAIRMMGAPIPRLLGDVIDRVGSVVETPTFFPHFSGRKNLLLHARVAGISAKTVDEMLSRVGLTNRANELYVNYSLGMRQRIGIAAALLKDPEVVLLDEPANGLDPQGIKEMRTLIRRLGREGRTIFLSSHLLTEVEQTCDRVAILSEGRCVATGTVEEVLRTHRKVGLLVRLPDLPAGEAALRSVGITSEIRGTHLRVELAQDHAGLVTQTLARNDLWLTELKPEEVSLEDVFLDLTSRNR